MGLHTLGPEEVGLAAPPPGQGRVSNTLGNAVTPLGHSRGLGTRVLVAAPADGLGPLPVVAQVPLDHVVVTPAPAAIFGKLDPCGEGRLTWARSHQAPTALPGPWGCQNLEGLEGEAYPPSVPLHPSRPSRFLKKP